jgi:Putative MetA-pathway of phenol degradation
MRTARRVLAALLLATATLVIPASAQTNSFCTAHAASLYCKIPSLFGTTIVNPLQPLDTALATQLTLVPLASPASGIVYTKNPANKLPVPSGTETFGPVFTDRGETLFPRKLFVAGVYQRFRFDSLDGVNLKQIPMLFYFCNAAAQCGPIAAIVRVDAHLDQFAIFATYGVTTWLDASIAVPILKVTLAANGVRCQDPYCSFQAPNGDTISFSNAAIAGSATGIGDIVVRAKASVFENRKFKFAVGTDVRLPSGDALNFLGAGSAGVKPFEAFSRSGRLSPHLNVAYQWNGNSELAGAAPGEEGKLPEVLSYAVGADAAVVKNLTVSADYLGEHVLSASRLAKVTTLGVANTTASSGSFDTVRGALGFKWKPFKQLLVSGNLLGKFDHNGLHHTAVPLFGISYTF